jgi:hypothetical protein
MTRTGARVRNVRGALASLLALGGVLCAAGCSSGPATPAARKIYGTAHNPSVLAQASIVECSIHARLLSDAELNSVHNLAQWYRDGHVIANVQYGTWWVHNQTDSVRGQTLKMWGVMAAQQQKLPAKLCPRSAIPSPSPST